MSRDSRLSLIRRIGEIRGTNVVAYVTSDRAYAVGQFGDDAVRPFLDHLRSLPTSRPLDVFIYSRGGAIDVPWRLNTAIRSITDSWTALIPFRANSAATLLALGADQIVMGPQAELGPIDPIIGVTSSAGVQEQLVVEDIMAFSRFMEDRFDLADSQSRAVALEKLLSQINAQLLGQVYRTHLHIRMVASKMLGSHAKPVDHETADAIVRGLAEQVYAHGHAIGFEEALALGLKVVRPEPGTETLLWELLETYEEDMGLRDPIDPLVEVATCDRATSTGTLAIIDSESLSHEFRGELRFQAVRQLPETLQVTLNMTVNIPDSSEAHSMTAAFNEELEGARQKVLSEAQSHLQQSLIQQAPLTRVDVQLVGLRWVESRN